MGFAVLFGGFVADGEGLDLEGFGAVVEDALLGGGEGYGLEVFDGGGVG